MAIVNIANLAAYAGNILLTFGFQSLTNYPDNGELSAKYQTLVTPAGYAFAIWGIIFLAQLIWTIVQLTSSYKSNPLVVNNDDESGTTTGVGYLYVAVCIAQCLWTIVFSIEQIPLSLVAMLSILISLVMIVERQSSYANTTIVEFWLLKFPLDIHCGWIWAASLVNFNVVLVAANTSSQVQTTFAWISLLGAVPAIAIYYTWFKQVWTIPIVLAWASYAISNELSNPRDSITAKFAEDTIGKLRDTSKWLAFGLLALTAVMVIVVSDTVTISDWVLVGLLGLTIVTCFWRGQKKRSRNNDADGTQEQPLVSDDKATTSYQDSK